MQTSGRVDQNHVGAAGFGRTDAVIDDSRRVASLLVADEIRSRTLRPDAKLLRRRGTEGIARTEHDLLAGINQLVCEFSDGSGLADTVDAHHQDNGRPGGQLQLRVAHIQKSGQDFDEALAGFFSLAVTVLPGFPAHEIVHTLRRFHSGVREDQHLFQVLVEVLAVGGIALKQLFQIDLLSGLSEASEQLVKQSHSYSSIVFFAASRSRLRTVETPFSCMVTP